MVNKEGGRPKPANSGKTGGGSRKASNKTSNTKKKRKTRNSSSAETRKHRHRMLLFTLKCLLTITIAFLVFTYTFMRYAITPVSDTCDIDGAYNTMFSEYPQLKHWVDSLNAHIGIKDTLIYSPDSVVLHGIMIESPRKTRCTSILVHGYNANAVLMLHLAYMYNHDLGYNVFLPDLRRHGESGGDHVQMGWNDRLDVEQWIPIVDRHFGGNTRMVVHGVSMGGATVMNMSGDSLPSCVRALIEDCGYTSVYDEFKYRLKEGFHLPSFPLLDLASKMCEWQYGWNFKEASCTESLKKSRLPMLFIHGAADKFVPTRMVYENYQSKPRDKYIYVAPNATHCNSFKSDKNYYTRQVKAFLNMYMYK